MIEVELAFILKDRLEGENVSMLDVLSQDYVRTAWAKGMPERLV